MDALRFFIFFEKGYMLLDFRPREIEKDKP